MDAWIWIVIAVVVVLVIIVAVAATASRRRRHHLQQRFGSEYDRTVEGADRRRAAERDLRDREARHDELELRPLSEASRQRYTEQWQDMQSRLRRPPAGGGGRRRPAASPTSCASAATRSTTSTRRSELVSVDHPDVVENYRTAARHRGTHHRRSHFHRGPAPGGDLLPGAVRGDVGRRFRQPQLTRRGQLGSASDGGVRPARAGSRGSGHGRASAAACPTTSSAGVPGRTSTTSTGGTPTASHTLVDDRVVDRVHRRRSWSPRRRRSTPGRARGRCRTRSRCRRALPRRSAAARSMSSGNTLRPPTMITSFSRPQTTSSPSTRYARSPVRSHPSSKVAAVASGLR